MRGVEGRGEETQTDEYQSEHGNSPTRLTEEKSSCLSACHRCGSLRRKTIRPYCEGLGRLTHLGVSAVRVLAPEVALHDKERSVEGRFLEVHVDVAFVPSRLT